MELYLYRIPQEFPEPRGLMVFSDFLYTTATYSDALLLFALPGERSVIFRPPSRLITKRDFALIRRVRFPELKASHGFAPAPVLLLFAIDARNCVRGPSNYDHHQ